MGVESSSVGCVAYCMINTEVEVGIFTLDCDGSLSGIISSADNSGSTDITSIIWMA